MTVKYVASRTCPRPPVYQADRASPVGLTHNSSLRLWRGEIQLFPYHEQGLFYPMIELKRWQWPHNAVHLHNKRSADTGMYTDYAGPNACKTFLLNPAASAYNFQHIIPTEAYECFLRRS